MKNLESLEKFIGHEILNSEMVLGGADIPTSWTDGRDTGSDIYDSSRHRIIYL
jgi:hypothetical protein